MMISRMVVLGRRSFQTYPSFYSSALLHAYGMWTMWRRSDAARIDCRACTDLALLSARSLRCFTLRPTVTVAATMKFRNRSGAGKAFPFTMINAWAAIFSPQTNKKRPDKPNQSVYRARGLSKGAKERAR